jgi:peptidoglycan/LPS O-acetylase OafA/YrhL
LPGLFATRPLRTLGALSYGVFLWHLPVLLALNRFADPPAGLLALATLAVALVLAELSRRYVERPALAAASRTRVPSRGENVMLRRVTRSA